MLLDDTQDVPTPLIASETTVVVLPPFASSSPLLVSPKPFPAGSNRPPTARSHRKHHRNAPLSLLTLSRPQLDEVHRFKHDAMRTNGNDEDDGGRLAKLRQWIRTAMRRLEKRKEQTAQREKDKRTPLLLLRLVSFSSPTPRRLFQPR